MLIILLRIILSVLQLRVLHKSPTTKSPITKSPTQESLQACKDTAPPPTSNTFITPFLPPAQISLAITQHQHQKTFFGAFFIFVTLHTMPLVRTKAYCSYISFGPYTIFWEDSSPWRSVVAYCAVRHYDTEI